MTKSWKFLVTSVLLLSLMGCAAEESNAPDTGDLTEEDAV
jgi:hypothetical protein